MVVILGLGAGRKGDTGGDQDLVRRKRRQVADRLFGVAKLQEVLSHLPRDQEMGRRRR